MFEVCAAEANDPRMRARGVRDAAMLALLYVGGLRRTELASLRLSDYDPQTKTVRIRGKGNKERQVYAEGGAEMLLASWLELRGEGEPQEPLFLPVRKDGEVRHTDCLEGAYGLDQQSARRGAGQALAIAARVVFSKTKRQRQ